MQTDLANIPVPLYHLLRNHDVEGDVGHAVERVVQGHLPLSPLRIHQGSISDCDECKRVGVDAL